MTGSSIGARRAAGCFFCLSAAWLQLPEEARAQDPAQAEPAEGASPVEELLRRGIQSREAGKDAEALALYRRAVAIEPENPRVLAHLGATYHALGRWVLAHEYLSRALRYGDDPYIERHRAQLSEALDTVGNHVGLLEVYGAPPGAEVLVNGQLVAVLPMSEPVPVTVGSYLLEVRLADHYTLGRPISIAKRALTREQVELAPHPAGRAALAPAAAPGVVGQEPPSSGGAGWLPWTLGGLSAAAAVTGVVAWERREHHAERWNDDAACLGVGISREERCGGELDSGQRAETILVVSGIAAGAFAAGAVLSAWLLPGGGDEAESAGSVQCSPGLLGAQCKATF